MISPHSVSLKEQHEDRKRQAIQYLTKETRLEKTMNTLVWWRGFGPPKAGA